jgi:hypothetical protein
LVDALLLLLLLPLLLVCWRWCRCCCFCGRGGCVPGCVVVLKMHVHNFDPHVSASVRMCPHFLRTSALCPHPIRTVSACVRILDAIFFTILS